MSLEIKGIWFKNCFIIHNYEVPFFKEGDSGSGVYLISKDGECNKALGIAFACMCEEEKTVETYVCKITEIVKAFNINANSEQEPMEFE